jgi:hypothetical protein
MRVRAKLELRARNNGAYLGHSAYGVATCDVPLAPKGARQTADRGAIGIRPLQFPRRRMSDIQRSADHDRPFRLV